MSFIPTFKHEQNKKNLFFLQVVQYFLLLYTTMYKVIDIYSPIIFRKVYIAVQGSIKNVVSKT